MGLYINNRRVNKKNLIKLKIKDMFNLPHTNQYEGVDIYTHKEFKKTTESIVENGYTPGDKFGYPEVLYVKRLDKYKVVEGNHRFKILKELYGPEYELEVVVVESMTEVWINVLYNVMRPILNKKISVKIFIDLIKFIISLPKNLLIKNIILMIISILNQSK